jgi:hypothetical protein
MNLQDNARYQREQESKKKTVDYLRMRQREIMSSPSMRLARASELKASAKVLSTDKRLKLTFEWISKKLNDKTSWLSWLKAIAVTAFEVTDITAWFKMTDARLQGHYRRDVIEFIMAILPIAGFTCEDVAMDEIESYAERSFYTEAEDIIMLLHEYTSLKMGKKPFEDGSELRFEHQRKKSVSRKQRKELAVPEPIQRSLFPDDSEEEVKEGEAEVDSDSGNEWGSDQDYAPAFSEQAAPRSNYMIVVNPSDLEKFRGAKMSKERAKEWMKEFEKMAHTCSWSAKEKYRQLVNKFDSSTQDWLYSLDVGDRKTWIKLRSAFMLEYATDSVLPMEKYINMQQRENETMLAYLYRLNRAAGKAKLDISQSKAAGQHIRKYRNSLNKKEDRDSLKTLGLSSIRGLIELLRRIEADDATYLYQRRSNNHDRSPKKYSGRNNFAMEQESDPESEEEADRDIYAAYANDKKSEPCKHCGRKHPTDGDCWMKMTCDICKRTGHPTRVCFKACPLCTKSPHKPHDKEDPCPRNAKLKRLEQVLKSSDIKIAEDLMEALN